MMALRQLAHKRDWSTANGFSTCRCGATSSASVTSAMSIRFFRSNSSILIRNSVMTFDNSEFLNCSTSRFARSIRSMTVNVASSKVRANECSRTRVPSRSLSRSPSTLFRKLSSRRSSPKPRSTLELAARSSPAQAASSSRMVASNVQASCNFASISTRSALKRSVSARAWMSASSPPFRSFPYRRISFFSFATSSRSSASCFCILRLSSSSSSTTAARRCFSVERTWIILAMSSTEP
mmetsp:Transcript_77346/g.196527  ORF Transcript_77346/g.196527 Transcript_77346/m.196527 type:complete len:238 (-) Transcript_77346:562-1275(-)